MKGILFSQGFVSKQAYHNLSNHVHLTNLFYGTCKTSYTHKGGRIFQLEANRYC